MTTKIYSCWRVISVAHKSGILVKNVTRGSRWSITNQRMVPRYQFRPYSTAEPGNSAEAETLSADDIEQANSKVEVVDDKELNELKSSNEKLAQQVKDTEDKYVRALAETENVRRRMRKQVEDAQQFGIQGFCKDLLTVADTLRLATDNIPPEQLENSAVKSMHEGLKLTESQLLHVFNKHGVKLSHPEGEKFDPNFHEAVFQQPIPDKEPGTVFVVTKPGYTLNDRVLRPALVGVVKAP